MSEKELIEYVLQNVAANPMIATDVGLEAAQQLGSAAEREQIEWALCGGLAMHLYGSERLTKDVDVIASARLSVAAKAPLTFGGDNYEITIGKYKVPVDWIVRNDAAKPFYQAALADALKLPSGLRIVTPEWLVIMKLIAGRQKDFDDCVFLLGRRNGARVDRPLVKAHIIRVGGETAWAAIMGNFRRLCGLADGAAGKEPGKYYDRD